MLAVEILLDGKFVAPIARHETAALLVERGMKMGCHPSSLVGLNIVIEHGPRRHGTRRQHTTLDGIELRFCQRADGTAVQDRP
jgi:hypothetical protein